MRKHSFTSGNVIVDVVACTFLFFEIGLVLSVPHRSLCSLCEASPFTILIGYKIERSEIEMSVQEVSNAI